MPQIRGVERMEPSSYKEGKEKGLIKMVKVGGSFAIEKKVFSVEDGTEKESAVMSISRADTVTAKETLEKQLDNINELIAEMDVLDPPKDQE